MEKRVSKIFKFGPVNGLILTTNDLRTVAEVPIKASGEINYPCHERVGDSPVPCCLRRGHAGPHCTEYEL